MKSAPARYITEYPLSDIFTMGRSVIWFQFSDKAPPVCTAKNALLGQYAA
jgi:hypothetical protein